METATKVFAIIQKVVAIVSIVATAIIWIAYLIIGPGVDKIIISIECPVIILVLVLPIIFADKALDSIASYDKKVWIGVCNILFGILLTGIFYLCWEPYKLSNFPKKSLYTSSSTFTKEVQQPHKEEKTDFVHNADVVKKYKELLDCGAITKNEFDDVKKQIFNEKNTNISATIENKQKKKVSKDTTIEDFDTTLYKTTISLIRVGTLIPALRDFTKQEIKIIAGNEYRYTAHYANTFQIVVDGKMFNLSEQEFIYIFLKK